MSYNPLDMFAIGQKIGQSKRSTFGRTTDKISEDFDEGMKIKKTLLPVMFKEVLERNRPMNELEQSQANLANAKASQMYGNTPRDIFLVNRRDGKIYKAGDQTKTPVDPSSVSQFDRIMSIDIPPASTSSMFTSSEASIKQIDNLIDLLSRNSGQEQPNKFVGGFEGMAQPLQGLSSKATQDYGIIRKDFSDRLLRLRSGAQINEQEYKRLMSMLPQWWRNSQSDIDQLGRFKNEYTSLMRRLSGEQSLGDTFVEQEQNNTQDNDDPLGIL